MTTEKLTIVAKIVAKTEFRDLVKDELFKLIAPTLKEEGCINYDLHQDHTNKDLFLFYENWETKPLWENHMKSAHIAAYAKATEHAVASFELFEMKNIS